MRVSSLVLVGLLVGCQSGVDVNASEDTFCDELAEVACHNLYQCCAEGVIESELGVSEPRTEDECKQDKTRQCESLRESAGLHDSLKAKRVQFNADAYNACLEAFLAPDDVCSTFYDTLPWTEPCDVEAWTGLVAAGGTCFFDHDCAGYPRSAQCGPDQKCVTLPVGGFPCVNGECAEDFFCGTGQICQARLAEGAPCLANDQCADKLFCDTSVEPEAVCASRKPAGSACTNSNGCVSGECIPGTCAMTGISCFTDTQCGAHCADDFSSCTIGMDYLCNPSGGHCDVLTSQTCSGSTADLQCSNAGAGTTCIFNVACVPGNCMGDPVCTAPLFQADYCAVGRGL